MTYGLEMEGATQMYRDRQVPTAPPRREPGRVVPSDVALERAQQNQKLAELRYDLAVRKGAAWSNDKKLGPSKQ
jgi:hypothetical protein